MPSLSAPNQGRAQALLGSSILFLVLPYPFVFLRFWARRIKKTPLAFNDYALFLALLFTSGYNVAIIMASIKGGYGQHMWTLSIEEITANLKVTVAVTFLWPTANSLIKISVLSFYKNVFYSQGRMMLLSIYALGALTLLYWGSTVIVAFALCRPFAYNWNKFTIQGTCGDQPAYYLSTGIVNLLIDVMIVALPLPCLWNLHMALSRKLSLMVIFSLGALICVLSVVRVVAISKLDFADATYNIVLDNIMSALEPTLGVINACLPLLQPIIPKVSETKIVTWFRSLTTLRSSGTGLSKTVSKQPSGESKSHHFERLTPDLYPLSDFSTTQRSLDSTIA